MYMDNFPDDPWYRGDEDDYDDSEEDYGDGSAAATENLSSQKFQMSQELKAEFIGLLLRDEEGATQAAFDFMESRKSEPEVTEVQHTLWQGQMDASGFNVYHVTHNLGTCNVVVSLDSTELYSYSRKDPNVVVIVCPESLWGVDVEVKVAEA